MGETQALFRKGYSTTGQIFTLSVLLNYLFVKVEYCPAFLLIIVRHLTLSTEHGMVKTNIIWCIGKST